MKKQLFKTFSVVALMLLGLADAAQAGTVQFGKMIINNMGGGGRMVRMGDNGIFLDQTGFCMESEVTLKLNGFNNQRLVLVVMPADVDGNVFEDRRGEMMTMVGFKVMGNQASKTVKVKLPMTWVYENDKKVRLTFQLSVLDSDVNEVASKLVTINPTDVNIDRNQLPGKMMGDIFGGGDDEDGGDLVGGLLGGLFGGPSATQEHLCSACDGTGLCPDCYGDAFFKPSSCRRCGNDPGICRRCKGNKKEKVEVELNGY